MKNVLSPKIRFFAGKVANIPFAKSLLKPFYYPYKERLNKRRNEAFHKNALNVLRQFDECMAASGYEYFLLFGSLLGAVREKGFISHDLDMDVAMWYEDFSPNIQLSLEKAGFKLIHSHEIDGGASAKEDTFEKDDVSIDIFYFYPAIDEYPYMCSKWKPVSGCITKQESMKKFGYITGKRLELPLKKGVERIPFETLQLPVPINRDEILAFYYGENYMTPNPLWSEDIKFPYRKEWPEKKASYIEYE